MTKRTFLFYPLIVLICILILDKIFLLPIFHTDFLQAGNSVFYAQRNHQIERLVQDTELSKKKLALVFGDSRSYPFSEKGIPEKLQKDWTLYNFSGPQAVPMYSYFMFRKILDTGNVTPSLVILSLSPEAFDDSKGFINSPFLRLYCKSDCIKEIWDDLDWRVKYDFILDKVFAIRSIEPNFGLFFSRLKSKKLNEYTPTYNKEYQLINYGKGEYLVYATNVNPTEKLEKDTRRVSSIYMKSFQVSQSQLKYTEKFLELAKAKKIKVILFWPKVYPKYFESYVKFRVEEEWWNKILEINSRFGMPTMNMNREDSCDLFNDASHQSVFCYLEHMKRIWSEHAP
ncbi:hypothetical protein LPTSP4_08770 [Leptospira ryugenii]|uniref:PF07611 family protein n=1 Tax=Leptospira ryugenii TaxID=1917863 RepID=A0A2P2DXN8_9LEPT|nr:DUF1574 domain-containing protein [Leptospira ryugenii]GBF49366.1 hypothetical protein LPTSP4_08770 [Leptospira ryugenii]